MRGFFVNFFLSHEFRNVKQIEAKIYLIIIFTAFRERIVTSFPEICAVEKHNPLKTHVNHCEGFVYAKHGIKFAAVLGW